METWREIDGYDGRYLVSDQGRVKSFARNRERILRPGKDHGGYLFVILCLDKKRETRKVHRLVASAFIDNPGHKGDVNHKNGVKTDNRAENLEWATRSENMTHAWGNGLHKATGAQIEALAHARECKMAYKAAKDAQAVLDSEKGKQ